MEEHKRLKPFFSQGADRLNDRVLGLIGSSKLYHDEHGTAHNASMIIATNASMNDTDK